MYEIVEIRSQRTPPDRVVAVLPSLDEALHVLSLLGADEPGMMFAVVIGAHLYRRFRGVARAPLSYP